MPESIYISLNPHSFIAFMTLAMGISYVFFNPHVPFGVMRLLAAIFLIIPIVLVGYQSGHAVDLVVGAILGFSTTRGLSLPNPFGAIRARYYQWKFYRAQKKQQRRGESSRFDNDAAGQAKADERAEQARQERARQERERQHRQKEKHKAGGDQSHQSSNEEGRSENSYQRSQSGGGQDYRQHTRVNAELAKAYSVLGIDENTSFEEAKRAYRKMCKEFHPDAQAGASESVKKMAEEKMKEVNVAWKQIKKSVS